MDDKKKQIAPWNFTQLQDSLEKFYGSPERLLLEAYKGLLYLVTSVDSETDLQILKDSVFPLDMLLNDLHRALTEKESEEFYLNHPEIKRNINK